VIRLVLFDVDGTLIRTGGAGSRAFVLAVEDVLGAKVDHSGFSFGGRTDIAICRGLLARGGVSTIEAPLLERVFDRYLFHLERELADRDALRLCTGVTEILAELAASPEFGVGLLTGNVEAAAHRKLAALGIDRYFHFGAFGSDEEDRNLLVPIARRRAAQVYGEGAGDARIVLVGDTPLDIRCARAGGARILAVATGLFDRTQLDPYGPDVLMDDLSRTVDAIAALRELSDLPSPVPLPTRSATPRTGD
jgi:phosphoglycolate phosphatase-like HAD superfamily hydrolase